MASEIKVDNIKDQCGTAVITKCGATHTVTAEVYKANTIQDTSGNAYLAKCGTTVTLGGCGQTIALAAGASQTGFGRTGTVDWDTTAKTTNFTAVSGNGYFVNTTSGVITVTLPASPSAGDIVSVSDYAQTAQLNNITIGRNGSNIEGDASDLVIEKNGIAMTFVYVDGTRGWKVVYTGTESDKTVIPSYITATGGTITCCGNYKIHTFTSPGTFTVTQGAGPLAVVDYRIVAGGGAGGAVSGGGGGGGGHRTNYPSCCSGIPVTTQGYPITVGAGGTAQASNFGNSGSDSSALGITSTGGGGGGGGNDGPAPGNNTGRSGGSGGGGGGAGPDNSGVNPGGTGNTPPVSPPQGNSGGPSCGSPVPSVRHGGGGGGAGATGGTSPTPNKGGNGGNGTANSITGSPVTYAGGGGGGSRSPSFGPSGPRASGGSGGGGYGGGGPDGGANGQAGTTNSGGGGGGGQYASTSGDTGSNGGSGIVIIRYKYQ